MTVCVECPVGCDFHQWPLANPLIITLCWSWIWAVLRKHPWWSGGEIKNCGSLALGIAILEIILRLFPGRSTVSHSWCSRVIDRQYTVAVLVIHWPRCYCSQCDSWHCSGDHTCVHVIPMHTASECTCSCIPTTWTSWPSSVAVANCSSPLVSSAVSWLCVIVSFCVLVFWLILRFF